MNKITKTELWIAASAGLVVMLLTWLQSYTTQDDVLYHFIWRADQHDSFVPIRNIGDVISSQIVHYGCVNGRVWVHFLAQVFIGLLGKTAFDIFNGFVFGGTVLLVARYVGRTDMLGMLSVVFVMMVLVPGFADVYLWVMGAPNYLWTSMAILLFLFVFEKKKKKKLRWTDWILGVLAVFAGCSHEALSLPLALSLSAYVIINRGARRSAAVPYVLFFIIGTLFCAFAPSTLMRTGELTPHHLVVDMFLWMYSMTQLRVTWVLIAVFVYVAWRMRKSKATWSDICNALGLTSRWYLFSSLILSIGIIYISGRTQLRVYYATEFFSMLVFLPAALQLADKKRCVVNAVMGIVLVAFLLPGIYYSWCGHNNYEYMLSQAKDSNKTMILVNPVQGCPYLIDKYTLHQVNFGPNAYFYLDETDEHLRAEALLLHLKSVIFLPSDLVNDIRSNHPGCNVLVSDVTGMVMAKRAIGDRPVKAVKFRLKREKPSFYKRFTAYDGYVYYAPRWKEINIDGLRYVFFDKPIPKISRRIRNVIVKY